MALHLAKNRNKLGNCYYFAHDKTQVIKYLSTKLFTDPHFKQISIVLICLVLVKCGILWQKSYSFLDPNRTGHILLRDFFMPALPD